tara:strand:- start:78 stop:485 length:408 start_codon:yes stop_codon:yes gene_type:complete
MVVIQCPHCVEDIELEDGASGLFDCPYCDKDFTWNGDLKVIVLDDDLKSKFQVFLFSIFSPSILFFVSLWLMVAVFSPSGWGFLLYYLISIGICILYTISLAIYGGLKKNKPLLQGILLSILVSILTIYMYAEVL